MTASNKFKDLGGGPRKIKQPKTSTSTAAGIFV
jgi:hypothetical protein